MSKYKTKVVRATKIIAKVAYLMIQCYFEYIMKSGENLATFQISNIRSP